MTLFSSWYLDNGLKVILPWVGSIETISLVEMLILIFGMNFTKVNKRDQSIALRQMQMANDG